MREGRLLTTLFVKLGFCSNSCGCLVTIEEPGEHKRKEKKKKRCFGIITSMFSFECWFDRLLSIMKI